MRKAGLIAGAAALALLAGCATRPASQPAPAPVPVPPPPPPAPPSPPPQDWQDIALTPGDWTYGEDSGGTTARFPAGFAIRCDRASGQVALAREGGGTGAMTIRTSAGLRSFPGPGATLPASDSFLDALVFSRGRFTVEVTGQPMLVLPSWPEPGRVVEDCRS
jgi:hypothetical protein